MKSKKFFLILLFLLLPCVFQSTDTLVFGIGTLIINTITVSVFVISPFSKLVSKNNSDKVFNLLLGIRLAILLFYIFFVDKSVMVLDYYLVILSLIIVAPVLLILSKVKKNNDTTPPVSTTVSNDSISALGVELKCAKCNSVLKITDKFCGNCGETFDGNNVKVIPTEDALNIANNNKLLNYNDFDPIYKLSEDKLLEKFINQELSKVGISDSDKFAPSNVIRKKKILNIMFSILIFIYTCLIFFHFPIYTYIIGLIILIILYIITSKYSLMKYLKKQITSRPQEKISNIVMSTKNSLIKDNSKKILLIGSISAIVLSLIIFINPKVFYEKTEGGYAVRFYAFGITNFETATIAPMHKGEYVVALRGNTFSNMPFLKEVNLPDTIKEIRGQAFKNDKKLVSVKLPSSLNYLGGGAFYNCTSLKEIVIPDSVTHIGGEAFYNANSLESVKLSNNLTGIRGNTFENCSSLKEIVIPDSVTRIGGHAFYGNSSLESVTISKNSKLTEIGSSAFRRCYNLKEITLPRNVYVNSRAFKESPTIRKYYSEYSNY